MRFIFGIVIGMLLTLYVATSTDAPTNPALSSMMKRLEAVWSTLIEATSDSLFQPPSEPITLTTPPLSPETVETTAEEESIDLAGVFADRPYHADIELPLASPYPGVEIPADPAPLVTAVPAALAPTSLTPTPIPEPLFHFPSSQPAPEKPAAAWEPFHSQMSAAGFARRLSRELEYPFRVERRGPGAYLVVFDAQSPPQRDMLLAQIAEMTGQ